MTQFQQHQYQFLEQPSFCSPKMESSSIDLSNQIQKSKQICEQYDFSLEIQQSSFNEDQNIHNSFLNFEKSRSGSQSECSWKSNTSKNRSNMQIIQSIGKRIIEIQEVRKTKQQLSKEEQSNEQSQFSLKSNSFLENEQELNLQVINKVENPIKYHLNTEQTSDFESQQTKKQQKQLFFNDLQKQLLKLYNLQDEKQLVIKIQEDLQQQCQQIEKKSLKESQEITSKFTTDSFEQQHQTYLKCVFLNLVSEINKNFSSYYQEINLNSTRSITQQNSQQNQLKFEFNQMDQDQYFEKQKISKQQNHAECLNNSELNFQLKQSIQYTLLDNIKPKSISFLKNFDFSDIRQNYQKKKQQQQREKKQNSSYVKNSQFHNLNKLFMYNILSMFRNDSLNNLNLPQVLMQELNKIILQLKMSSRRDYKNPTRGFFDYFSHSHYKVLFLKINNQNIKQARLNQQDVDLHLKCYQIDLSQEIPEIDLTYMNLIKEINYRIFSINIQENLLFDDGTSTKQNIRKMYALKVIEGIKKLIKGIITKRF
ncbi:hypothetical protein ABPG74_013418 [Tetrahymena malaccensis]